MSTTRGYKGVEDHRSGVRISFMLNGERIREMLPNIKQTNAGHQQAAKIRAEILDRIKLGTFRFSDYFPDSQRAGVVVQRGAHLFSDIADKWLDAQRLRIAPKTAKGFESQIKFWKEQFAGMKIADIDYLTITSAFANKKAKAKTRNNYLIPLRAIFNVAVHSGYIPNNPTALIENEPVEKPEIDPLRADERDRILEHMRKHCPETVFNYFCFAFWTGLRPAELIELRWGDVDLQQKKVFVTRGKVEGNVGPTKTRAKWPVNLLPGAFDALMRQRALTALGGASAHVFTNPATKHGWNDEQRQRRVFWTPTLHALGIKQRDAYNTRHTYATTLLMRGIKPAYIASQLGHTSPKMIYERYSRWMPDDAEDAAEAARAAEAVGGFSPPIAPRTAA